VRVVATETLSGKCRTDLTRWALDERKSALLQYPQLPRRETADAVKQAAAAVKAISSGRSLCRRSATRYKSINQRLAVDAGRILRCDMERTERRQVRKGIWMGGGREGGRE